MVLSLQPDTDSPPQCNSHSWGQENPNKEARDRFQQSQLQVPGRLVQHGFNLVYLIPTEVDHSEVNPAVLPDTHVPEPKHRSSGFIHVL